MQGQIDAFKKYGVPALAYMEDGAKRIFKPGVGLGRGWEVALEARVNAIRPHFGVGKAIRGVAYHPAESASHTEMERLGRISTGAPQDFDSMSMSVLMASLACTGATGVDSDAIFTLLDFRRRFDRDTVRETVFERHWVNFL